MCRREHPHGSGIAVWTVAHPRLHGALPAEQPLAPDTGERGWCGAEAALYRSPVQVKRQIVSKVDFLKMRSNKINGLQSQNAPKTGF